jgi:dihydroflavonol-4-reductase
MVSTLYASRNQMAKVAVTGATGFVGSALVQALHAAGHEIIALARPSSARTHLADLDITWVNGDVTDPATLKGAFSGAGWLIHAAGRLGEAGVPESVYHDLHANGTRHVLNEAAAASIARILYVSSPGVLGPISGAAAVESAPLAPSNAYERSKAAAEQVALALARDGLPVIIARPEFIYGPGDSHVLGLFRAVERGIFFTIGRGQHTCHPTFVTDAVRGLVACLEHGRCGEIYHITGPGPVTFQELGQTIAAALGVRSPWLRIPRPLAWSGAAVLEAIGRLTGMNPPLSRSGVAFFSESRRFSWQKAHRELGYTPQVDLAEGVSRTVAWYQKKGMLKRG